MNKESTLFTASFAEIPIRVNAFFPSTRVFCSQYISEDSLPLASVSITYDDIAYARKMTKIVAEKDGLVFNDAPDTFFEKIALHKTVSDVLPSFGRALFHCSSIMVDGEAVLFTARSGTGKSTHSRIWKKVYGDAVNYVNDDKPFIGLKDGIVQVFGSPWQGKHNLGQPVTVPVKGIGIIIRDEKNFSVRINSIDAIRILLIHMHRPKNMEAFAKTIDIIKAIVENIPFYEIHCNMDDNAAIVSYNTFFGE